jgi:hypothetical protein
MRRNKSDKARRYWFGRRHFETAYGPVTWQGWVCVALFAIALALIGRGVFMLLARPFAAALIGLAATLAITLWFVRFVENHVDPRERE